MSLLKRAKGGRNSSSSLEAPKGLSWTNLLDRRTLVTLLTNLGLFILAFRNIKPEVAIDAAAFITVALIAGNASQRSLIAWAGRSRGSSSSLRHAERGSIKKTTSTRLEKKDGT